jgi:MFS family permease
MLAATSPLRNRDFRHLWIAGLISDAGDWMLMVTLPVLVYQLTGSTSGTSIAFLAELAPAVLIAPAAGKLADRADRRKMLITVSLIQAAALSPLLAGTHLVLVYLVIAAQAGLAAAFDPAKNALLPTLVGRDQLVPANSLTGLNQNLGRLLGGSLGGLLLATGHLGFVAVADAASFLLAVLLIAGVRTPAPVVPAPEAAADRARVSARRPVRAGLAVVALTAVAQGLFIVLSVIFVARSLHGGAAENGLLRAVQAIGAIGGGLLLARARRISPGRLTASACLVFGAFALLTWNLPGLTTFEPVYVALFIAVGAPAIAMTSGLISTLQHATADGERGRVFAAFGLASTAGQALGILAAGVLGDRLGVVLLLNVQAALYLAGGLVALGWLTEHSRPQPRRRHPGGRPAGPRKPGRASGPQVTGSGIAHRMRGVIRETKTARN